MNGIPKIILFFFIWIAIVLKYLNESTYVVKDEFIIVGLKFPVFKGRGPTQDKNP